MIVNCERCGARIHIEKKSTTPIVTGLVMLAIAVGGSLVFYKEFAKHVETTSSAMGDSFGKSEP